MISDALILAAIFASGGLIGYIVGSWRGWQRGRDEQWVDCFLAGEARGDDEALHHGGGGTAAV